LTAKAEHISGDRYRVRIYFGADPATGKPIQRAKYFRAKGQRDANRLAAGVEAALREELDEAKAGRGTVAELVDLWVKHRAARDSPATVYRRQSILAAIKRDLGKIPVDKLRPLDIDQWYDHLRAENVGQGVTVKYRSESTIHHYHRVLHAILEQAYRWEMTDRKPGDRATAPKVRRKVQPWNVTPAAVVALINAAEPDLAVAVRVLAATGLRRGEMMALTWVDVNLDAGLLAVHKSLVGLPGGRLIVKSTKTDDPRIVEIDPTTVQVLADHRRRWEELMPGLAVDAYLFPNPLTPDRAGRTPRHPDWASQRWRALCAREGARIRLHDLRHFHLSTLIDLGVNVLEVAGRGGHARPSTTTDMYGRRSEGAGRRAALQIEAALSRGLEKEQS